MVVESENLFFPNSDKEYFLAGFAAALGFKNFLFIKGGLYRFLEWFKILALENLADKVAARQ